MRHLMLVATALLALGPHSLAAQRGGMGGRPGMDRADVGRELPMPKLPGPELEGPPDTVLLKTVLDLTADQVVAYGTGRDSFMLATKPQRDSAFAVQNVMYQRLDSGDRVAAVFHAERLEKLTNALNDRQNRFERRLSDVLASDQVQQYRDWKREQERLAEARHEEEALRWRAMPFGAERPVSVDARTVVETPGLPRPDAGSQAIRVGRTLYVSSQVAVDSSGIVIGEGDLAVQARRAFDNLTAVLTAARALPSDVVRLTVYVVGYRPQDLSIIRNAGPVYFPVRNAPVTTVLGVESLSREGLLIAVEATALIGMLGGDREGPGSTVRPPGDL